MPTDTKPAVLLTEGDGGHRKIQIAQFKALSKNTLKAVFDVVLPSGMQIHGCMLHESNGVRWIGLPGKPYRDAGGNETYARIIDFVDRATYDRFQRAVMDALGAHLAEAPR
jgi:hypothetical protein